MGNYDSANLKKLKVQVGIPHYGNDDLQTPTIQLIYP